MPLAGLRDPPAKPPPPSESALKLGCAGPCEDASGKIERCNTYFKVICGLDLLTVNVCLVPHGLSLRGSPRPCKVKLGRRLLLSPPLLQTARPLGPVPPKHTTNPLSSAPQAVPSLLETSPALSSSLVPPPQ